VEQSQTKIVRNAGPEAHGISRRDWRKISGDLIYRDISSRRFSLGTLRIAEEIEVVRSGTRPSSCPGAFTRDVAARAGRRFLLFSSRWLVRRAGRRDKNSIRKI